MAEWSIAAVLKTVDVKASGGSNPSLSAEFRQQKHEKFRKGPQTLRLRAFLTFSQKRKKAHKKPAFFSQILRAFGGPDFTEVSRGSSGSRCFEKYILLCTNAVLILEKIKRVYKGKMAYRYDSPRQSNI